MAEVKSIAEQYHVLETRYNEDGQPTVTATFTPTADTKRCAMVVKTSVIPVLFVPGIMGSNLNYVDKDGNTQEAWGPPNNIVSGFGQVLNFWAALSAADRAERLNPYSTSVKWDGPVEAVPNTFGDVDDAQGGYTLNGKKLALKRGWGSVHKDSYGAFLVKLQSLLDQMCFETSEEPWKSLLALRPERSAKARQAESADISPVTPAELDHARDFHYPVYACGYNWIHNNEFSATGYKSGPDAGVSALSDQVDRILADIRAHRDKACNQVILVTHSMGGLVARAYAKAHPDKILGIVHGVMPATGAPATYKRVRAGFGGEGGGIEGWGTSKILGPDADRAAPPILNSEGALQLLPWPDYGAGIDAEHIGSNPPLSQWLQVRRKGQTTPVFAPGRDEVLMGANWFSLLPSDIRNEYVGRNSGVIRNKRVTPSDEREMALRRARGITEKPEDDRRALNARLVRVGEFQDNHRGFYLNGKTFAFYGSDPAQRSWWSHVWEGDIPVGISAADMQRAVLKKDDGEGKVVITLPDRRDVLLTIAPASDSGDGTVPSPSGMAPQIAGVPSFVHQGYDHQSAYIAGNQLGLLSTLFSVIKFAQQRKD